MRFNFHLGKKSRYPWLFFVLAIAANAGIYIYIPEAKALELYLPATGVVAGFIHFLYSQHHQDAQLFVTLFKEFNSRYDTLNERLNAIVERPSNGLSTDDRKVLFDYFNLCAEEYLFYKAGYIDHDVWCSWLAGMKYFYRKGAVRNLWESEIKGNSYYGFSLTLFDAEPAPGAQHGPD